MMDVQAPNLTATIGTSKSRLGRKVPANVMALAGEAGMPLPTVLEEVVRSTKSTSSVSSQENSKLLTVLNNPN